MKNLVSSEITPHSWSITDCLEDCYEFDLQIFGFALDYDGFFRPQNHLTSFQSFLRLETHSLFRIPWYYHQYEYFLKLFVRVIFLFMTIKIKEILLVSITAVDFWICKYLVIYKVIYMLFTFVNYEIYIINSLYRI